MEKLILVLFLAAVSAIGTWLQKRNAAQQDGNESPQTPPARPKANSWEDELRRLLGEEPTAPSRPVRPPPVVEAQPPRMRPMASPPAVIRPVMIPPRRPVAISAPAESDIEKEAGEMAPMNESRRAYGRASQLDNDYSTRELAPLQESKSAYARASQLDKVVAAHIERTPGQRVVATRVTHGTVSPEITGVVSLFKNARSARQAVIASVILGPPRAMEELTAGFDR